MGRKKMEEMSEDVMDEMKAKGGSFGSLMKGILIGGIVGAAIALLNTPRTGEETRQMLREKSNELRDQAMNKVEETRSKAEEMTRSTSGKANELLQRGEKVLNQQKVRAESVVEGIKEGTRTYQELGANQSESYSGTIQPEEVDVVITDISEPDDSPDSDLIL